MHTGNEGKPRSPKVLRSRTGERIIEQTGSSLNRKSGKQVANTITRGAGKNDSRHWRSRIFRPIICLASRLTVSLLSFISSAKSAVKFCGFGITFAEISFCTCLENSIKETINMMKPKQIFISILAVLFVFPLMGTFAQQAANSGSIEVITTFDYPGTGIVTTSPQKINERGDIVGVFIDSNGVERGFVRFSDGSFSAPIVDPNDTVGFTEGRGINNLGTVCGDYATSDGNSHGFFLSGGTFTEYDVPGAVSTVVLGINDAASLTGGFDPGSGICQGFVSVGGTITSFSVPGAILTLAYETNNSNELVVGYYIDSSGILHGYFRNTNGALHFPIDPSGSVVTVLFGLNDKDWVVGRYAVSSGATHGVFFVPPNQFSTFDYPGSTFTSLNGIN